MQGQEAISINGVRVLAMTDIVDVDSYILVNLQRIQGPYVVKAIGDKDYISTILQLKGSGFCRHCYRHKCELESRK